MEVFYTYIYLDPRKPGKFQYGKYSFGYEPFYVGKGKNNRDTAHLKKSLLTHNKQLRHKILKLEKLKLPTIVERVKETCDEKEALNLEILLIQLIGRKDKNLGVLLNLTDGGQGVLNKKTSLKTIEKIRNSNIGKIISQETKNKQSIAQTGKKRSKESIDKMKIHHYKPVIFIDVKENICQEFESMKEAAKSTGFCVERISAYCNKNLTSNRGKYFRFVEK